MFLRLFICLFEEFCVVLVAVQYHKSRLFGIWASYHSRSLFFRIFKRATAESDELDQLRREKRRVSQHCVAMNEAPAETRTTSGGCRSLRHIQMDFARLKVKTKNPFEYIWILLWDQPMTMRFQWIFGDNCCTQWFNLAQLFVLDFGTRWPFGAERHVERDAGWSWGRGKWTGEGVSMGQYIAGL